MGQVNRVTASNLPRIDRIDRHQQLPQGSERHTDEGAAFAGRTSDHDPVGMPALPPQSWPRVFPGL